MAGVPAKNGILRPSRGPARLPYATTMFVEDLPVGLVCQFLENVMLSPSSEGPK